MRWALLLLLLLEVGCARRVPTDLPRIIGSNNRYVIDQQTPDVFIVYATSTKNAQDAIDAELECNKRPCVVTPAGVIFWVGRPVIDGKQVETPSK